MELVEIIEDFRTEVLEKRISLLNNVYANKNQGEGWLKFELIDFLSKQGICFETEISVGKKVDGKRQTKIDLRIEDDWIELKQILIGKQNEQSYCVSSYLTKSYIENDIKN